MKIQILSDLHLERMDDYERVSLYSRISPWFQNFDSLKGAPDVLVLAGDIMEAKYYGDLRDALEGLVEGYKHVIYVPGNHEYYGSDPETVNRNLDTLMKDLPNIQVLRNGESYSIGTQNFIGGTMWYRPDPLTDASRVHFSDFKYIRNFYDWVYARQADFEVKLERMLDSEDIVITHHLPSMQSVAPEYKKATSNAWFVCEMDYFLEEYRPKLWIHGHTHVKQDYIHSTSGVRVICNPGGYEFEPETQAKFDPQLIIEV